MFRRRCLPLHTHWSPPVHESRCSDPAAPLFLSYEKVASHTSGVDVAVFTPRDQLGRFATRGDERPIHVTDCPPHPLPLRASLRTQLPEPRFQGRQEGHRHRQMLVSIPRASVGDVTDAARWQGQAMLQRRGERADDVGAGWSALAPWSQVPSPGLSSTRPGLSSSC
jgi:hypothetical protein